MNQETFFAFALFSYIASGTPGPNNVMLTALGRQFGVVRGLPAMLGVCGGAAFMIFLLAFGAGEVLLRMPNLMIAMKIIGALVLFWMSWKIATSHPVPISDDQTVSGEKASIGFWAAFFFQWINPKAILVTSAAVTTYMHNDLPPWYQGMIFAVTFFLVGLVATFPWLYAGSLFQQWFGDERRGRLFNGAMGLLLASTILLII